MRWREVGGAVRRLPCPIHSHKQLILCAVLTIRLPAELFIEQEVDGCIFSFPV